MSGAPISTSPITNKLSRSRRVRLVPNYQKKLKGLRKGVIPNEIDNSPNDMRSRYNTINAVRNDTGFFHISELF